MEIMWNIFVRPVNIVRPVPETIQLNFNLVLLYPVSKLVNNDFRYIKFATHCIILYGHIFFIVRNCSFFMGIIFCTSVALVWTFHTRGVYNFIAKEANTPVNLVPFSNDVSFLFCRFINSGVTNELKSIFLWKSKKVRVIYFKQGKTLLLIKLLFRQHMYGGPLQPQFFLKKE